MKKTIKTFSQKRRIIFLHIPKTGGTTLQEIISRNYVPEMVFRFHDSNLQLWKAEFEQLSEDARNQRKIFLGHTCFGIHQFLPPPSTYITLVRDPVERILSHYYYVLSTPDHYLHSKIVTDKISIKEYVCCGIMEVDNFQTRLISGVLDEVAFGQCTVEMLEIAKKNIQQYFSVVGLMKQFDKSLLLLKKKLRWKRVFYVKRNVTSYRCPKDSLAKDILQAIERSNQIDIALYTYAQKQFEILVQQYPYFEEEVKRFKLLNKIYSRVMPLFHQKQY